MSAPDEAQREAFAERLRTLQAQAERALARWLPSPGIEPARLHDAMHYATLGNGKRIRPVLVYAAGEAIGADPAVLDAPAAAVEYIHAYSLVHDDLPAMDDDDLRRGRPTCHRAYDEATAILAGDALQALAFQVLATAPGLSAGQRVAMAEVLARAAGSRGMVGGQAIDLAAEGRELTLAELENLHIHKTGALIRAAARLGALAASDADRHLVERLDHYAKCIGLAFQVRDDILDVEGSTEVIGKPRGSDIERGKATYPALLGLDGARAECESLLEEAQASLEPFGERGEFLRRLAAYVVHRSH